MYIIHEDELVHVERGSDILEHYGVKGMHWGQTRLNILQAKHDRLGNTIQRISKKHEIKEAYRNGVKQARSRRDRMDSKVNRDIYKKQDKLDKAFSKSIDRVNDSKKFRNLLTKKGRQEIRDAKSEFKALGRQRDKLDRQWEKNYDPVYKNYRNELKQLKANKKQALRDLKRR